MTDAGPWIPARQREDYPWALDYTVADKLDRLREAILAMREALTLSFQTSYRLTKALEALETEAEQRRTA